MIDSREGTGRRSNKEGTLACMLLLPLFRSKMEPPFCSFFFFFLPLLLLPALVEPFLPFVDPFTSNPLLTPTDHTAGDALAHNAGQTPAARAKAYYDTEFTGAWKTVSENSGVSAMHMMITHKNKAIIFDSTIFQPSRLRLPEGNCRVNPFSPTGELDCWAHAIEFDIATTNIRPLKVLTDTWCSSGSFDADGNIVQTGGFNEGARAIRYLSTCDTCDWIEYPTALSGDRWYATQHKLPDGSFIVIGGRRMFNYEFVPPAGQSNVQAIDLHFLNETTDPVENNLYPFVHLSPDGNLFIFANNRAILLDPKANKIVREFPPLRGGSRNYPASGSSALLPIVLGPDNMPRKVEVIVCGGGHARAFAVAEKGIFLPALQSCGRIVITKPDTKWRTEQMPMRRTMGDMLNLPNGELLLLNGASKGCSGWWFARDPVLHPVVYRHKLPRGQRFRVLTGSTIPRMYHASSALLPDASILVGGSNTNNGYNFTNVLYPTELKVERFSPPYLDPQLVSHRPSIVKNKADSVMTYGRTFGFRFSMPATEPALEPADVQVTMYAPPFTTHGYSMNQRLLVLNIERLRPLASSKYKLKVTAPPNGAIAPAGYYLVFVVNRGVPSKGLWVKLH